MIEWTQFGAEKFRKNDCDWAEERNDAY